MKISFWEKQMFGVLFLEIAVIVYTWLTQPEYLGYLFGQR